MSFKVSGFRSTPRFDRDIRSAPPEVRRAASDALNTLKANPHAKSLRLHPLKGFGKPQVWKIDVLANHAWQITFELEGDVAKLCRLARHKRIDNDPRA